MNKSPSVSIIERDMSTYTVTSSSSTIAVVGYATKGPVGTPTTVTSLKEFREKFGYAALLPYSYLAVAKAFNQTNKVIFTRVADETATTSQKVINNVSAQVNGYTTLTKYTDVTPLQVGFHAAEMYGLTVNSRNLFISAKATGGWGLDDMVSKLSLQLAATNGFQEFTAKSVTGSATGGLYGFKATVNGTASMFTGSNQTMLVEIDNTDNLSTIATKINDQIISGTRSYTYNPLNASFATNLGTNTYKFKVQVGSNPVQEYTMSWTQGNTYTQLATAMDTACSALGEVGVYAVDDGGTKKVIVYAKSLGNVGSVALSAGSTSDLFTPVNVWGSWTGVTGATGTAGGTSTGFIAEKHIDTLRLRLTSLVTKAATSTMLFVNPDAPFNNSDANLITLLTSAMTAVAGKDALATVAVTRDTVTRKIKFTSTTTVAPTIASLENGVNYYSLSTLLTGIDTPVTGTAAVTVLTSDKVILESQETGSATSLIQVVKSTYTDPLTLVSTVNLEVIYDNITKETFSGMSLKTADDNFIENVVNATSENGGSSWITIDTVDTNSDGTIVFPDGTYTIGKDDGLYGVGTLGAEQVYDNSHTTIGTYDYRLGTDGIPQIGGEQFFVDALSTSGDLANDEINNFHILITPDNATETVQNAAITLAESRQDFMYIVDPAIGLTYSQAKDWHNGIGGHGRSNAVNSSYAAVYWPWLKEYDADNGKYVWCPPSVFIGEKYLEVDRVYNPWYAPAGDTRGRLIAQDIETSPSFAQREILYGDLNCVNPIVKFNAQGIEVYGQKTALRQLVASNRVNVKRMLIYIKKLVKVALNSMIFEPNNPDSWQTATNLVTSILEPIRQDNGLAQYKVVINSTVNTPDVIAQNQMKGIIKLVPTNTIEMIEMNINVYKSGTTIT